MEAIRIETTVGKGGLITVPGLVQGEEVLVIVLLKRKGRKPKARRSVAPVAGRVAMTEALVVEKPEKKKAPMPGGHYHGGMDGMNF